MIRKSSDFKWPKPLKMDSAKRDRNIKCAYHKEHEHTTEQCRSLHYLVEKLVRVERLRQYVHLEGKNGVTSQSPTTTTPVASTAPRVVINYIHDGPINEEYNSKQKRWMLLQATFVREQVSSIKPELISRSMRSIDGEITFPLVDSNRILQSHRGDLILSLGISDFDVRWILVDLGSSVDLLQVSVIKHMGLSPLNLENPGQILLGF